MQARPFAATLFILFLLGCDNNSTPSDTSTNTESVPVIDYSLVQSYPHDTNSFTEGFFMHDGKLFESTGATNELPQTRSLFGIVDLETGTIHVKAALDSKKYFGEGIAMLNGKIFQLTYKTKVGFIYDAVSFKEIGKFSFPSQEGWGLTTDGTSLVMSDGTNRLYFLDPVSLQATKTISVSERGYARDHINELEYIDGAIYANIWTTNTIVKIDPVTGNVTGKLDLSSLANEATHIFPGSLEMNGIAYDPAKGSILITGKMWPKIYEIKISK